MCYAGGPYCDGIAKKRFQSSYLALKEDPDNKQKKQDFFDKRFEYEGTPDGQKVLQRKIEMSKNPAEKFSLTNRKEAALRDHNIKLAAARKAEADRKEEEKRIAEASKKSKERGRRLAIGNLGVNETYPHPQANRLDKVSTTVDSIEAGANTANSISRSLGVVDRQGYYYGDAAGYLGFVESTDNGDLKEYYLTERGQAFAGASPEQRGQIIADTINSMPLMQVYREDGEEAALDFIKDSSEANETTAERRLATLKAWDKEVRSQGFSTAIERDRAEGQQRFVDAKTYADEQKAKRDKPKVQERRGSICGECFMEKPLSGICPNCDE